jgi:hypothetical protein
MPAGAGHMKPDLGAETKAGIEDSGEVLSSRATGLGKRRRPPNQWAVG